MVSPCLSSIQPRFYSAIFPTWPTNIQHCHNHMSTALHFFNHKARRRWGETSHVLGLKLVQIRAFQICGLHYTLQDFFFFLFGLSLSHSLQLFILNDFHFLTPPTQTVASSYLPDDLISLAHKENRVIPSFPWPVFIPSPNTNFLAFLCTFFSFILVSEENVSLLYKR